MARTVAIGDLSGAVDVLASILRGVGVIDTRHHWAGGQTHLVQLGDIFNRGSSAKQTMELLIRLRKQAPKHGGKVTMLLGNHEAMVALKDESYCTADEYLAFATPAQQRAWPDRRMKRMRALYIDHTKNGGPVLPLEPQLSAWAVSHVPGRAAFRRALGPRGELGKAIRSLPVAVIDQDCVFCHSAIEPQWAELGIEGLNQAAQDAWKNEPKFFPKVSESSILRDLDGPLWNRELALKATMRARERLARSLHLLSAKRMVVGHTHSDRVPGGQVGRIALAHDGRLACIDVGLSEQYPDVQTALVIEDGRAFEWTPTGERTLWRQPRGA